MPPLVTNTLREWKLTCPQGKLGFVFPNGAGNVEVLSNIIHRGFIPVQIAAGVTGEPELGEDGEPVPTPKYTGLHALRHFYASWCANIGLSMKVVQARMGHSNIAVTMDTYTHIFPVDADDSAKLAAAERALLA